MTTHARGMVARIPGAPAQLEEFTIGDPGPGEALVRILASGICHTDYGVKMGHYGSDGFPFLLGHEGAGIVEAVGEGVTNVKPGDSVVLAWRAPCGACRFCLRGQMNLCAASLNAEKRMTTHDGLTLNPVLGIGTFCTHTLVHSHQCVPVPADLPPAQLSLIGCGVMTGVGAAFYAAKVTPGSSVAVFGCGGVGDSVIMGAKLAGATRIIAVDVDSRKLEWASQCGATNLINARDVDAVARIKELTGGHGVEFSFEAAGTLETLEQAIFCRDLAGTCVIIGVPGASAMLNVSMQKFFDLGGSVRVSWYGDCLPTRDFPMLADYYRQGRLNLDLVVTREVKLDETEDAFSAMERGETLRSVIVF